MAAIKRHKAGFTLIEITFAILILAGSLVVLLGLQSSSIERTLRDKNKQQAMLVARQMLAAIEISTKPLEIGEQKDSAAGLLDTLMPEGISKEESEAIPASFQADLVVSFWPLPNLDPQAVKRLDLTISWSDSPLDELSVTYFLPFEPIDEDG